jgi:hypothetical protein
MPLALERRYSKKPDLCESSEKIASGFWRSMTTGECLLSDIPVSSPLESVAKNTDACVGT